MVAAQMMWTFTRRPELKVPVLGWGVFLQGVGFAVAGAGADACATYGQGSAGGVTLLYLGFTLFVGVAEGLLELIVCYWGLLYWNVDGQKGKGVGIFGGAMGLGAVFWTLVSLWLLTSASLATTLYCLGAIQFVMALPVAWAVRSGLLSHPPTQAEFDAWTGHEESEVAKEDDCPALEAALPGFVEALRTEWAAREPSAAPRVVAAPAEAPEKPPGFFGGLFSRGKGS